MHSLGGEEMSKVRVTVTDNSGKRADVLTAAERTVRSRLLDWLFGQRAKVVIITPEKSVDTIEIDERKAF